MRVHRSWSTRSLKESQLRSRSLKRTRDSWCSGGASGVHPALTIQVQLALAPVALAGINPVEAVVLQVGQVSDAHWHRPGVFPHMLQFAPEAFGPFIEIHLSALELSASRRIRWSRLRVMRRSAWPHQATHPVHHPVCWPSFAAQEGGGHRCAFIPWPA